MTLLHGVLSKEVAFLYLHFPSSPFQISFRGNRFVPCANYIFNPQ